jgi:hypothetical protein
MGAGVPESYKPGIRNDATPRHPPVSNLVGAVGNPASGYGNM